MTVHFHIVLIYPRPPSSQPNLFANIFETIWVIQFCPFQFRLSFQHPHHLPIWLSFHMEHEMEVVIWRTTQTLPTFSVDVYKKITIYITFSWLYLYIYFRNFYLHKSCLPSSRYVLIYGIYTYRKELVRFVEQFSTKISAIAFLFAFQIQFRYGGSQELHESSWILNFIE